MNWFNWIGLIIIAMIMLPNVVYSIRKKEEFSNAICKTLMVFEQIGRFGCIIFMTFNLPYTYFNFWFNHALLVYIIINAVLTLTYVALFFATWNQKSWFKVISLSLLPSLIFLFSGVALINIPLIIFAVIFTTCHVMVSVKNFKNN